MPSQDAVMLAKLIRDQTAIFLTACEGLDEAAASRAPEGRWSPREIVSHLIGPEGTGITSFLRAFLEKDTPLLDMEAENPYFSSGRGTMAMDALLAEFRREYDRMADFVSKLTDEELGRKARVPMLKESPLGEYPTLEQMIEGIAGYHLSFHIDHLKEIRQAIKA